MKLKICISLLLVMTGSLVLSGQNLYDLENSKKFAWYLMQSNQFELARQEWSRVIFLAPRDTSARLNYLIASRKAGKTHEGISQLTHWYPPAGMPEPFAREGLKMGLLNQDHALVNQWTDQITSLPQKELRYYELSSLILQGKWKESVEFTQDQPVAEHPGYGNLTGLAKKGSEMKPKSPFLAATLSAIIPGTGKVYTGDWKDGIISFLFVATNAFQCYRGFSQKGFTNAYGWIFGTLTVGFYGANIFGSVKSARDYNHRQRESLIHEAQHIIFDNF